MKTLFALSCAALLAIGLSACAGGGPGPSSPVNCVTEGAPCSPDECRMLGGPEKLCSQPWDAARLTWFKDCMGHEWPSTNRPEIDQSNHVQYCIANTQYRTCIEGGSTQITCQLVTEKPEFQ